MARHRIVRRRMKHSHFGWLSRKEEKMIIENFSHRAQQKVLEKIKNGFSISSCNENKIELKGKNCFYMVGTERNMDQL